MASANGLAGFESVLEVQKDVKATLEGADGGLEEPAQQKLIKLLRGALSDGEVVTQAALTTLISTVVASPASLGPSATVELLSTARDELDDVARGGLSQSLADAMWQVEHKLDLRKGAAAEILKAPATEEQDDAAAARKAAATAETDQVAMERGRLVELAKGLLQGSPPVLHAEDCRQSWEYSLLFETGVVGFNQDAFARQSTRINTANLYKQQRFNLLREESEGYAHLAAELISEMGPPSYALLVPARADGSPVDRSLQRHQSSYPHHHSIVATGESPDAIRSRAAKVVDSVKALIGYFDLDPNRTLDIILDIFAYNVMAHHEFFRALLRQSSWLVDAATGGAESSSDVPTNGTLGPERGSQIVAALLGFKFTFYQRADTKEPTPPELSMLAAILIWDGAIKLSDLLPYLSPDDTSIRAAAEAWRNDVAKKGDDFGPRNALSQAGALDGGAGPARSSSRDGASTTTTTKSKDLPNQRSDLLAALLSIGALQESIFLLSLPGHAFLASCDPVNSALLLRLLDVAIRPAAHAEGVDQDGVAEDAMMQLTAPKRRLQPGSGGKHELVAPEAPKATLTLKALAKESPTKGAQSVVFEHVFFWPHWQSRLTPARDASEVLDNIFPLLRFVGPHGHLDLGLFHRIARLTARHIAPGETVADGKRPAPDARWLDVVRLFLLPSLSMMDACVAASNDVWACLEWLDYEDRFKLYGEWKTTMYRRYPELAVASKKADGGAKRVLKTMTTDNAKEKSRALARLAVTNPLVCFNVALTQIQTYSNLIPVVVETLRYLNPFSFDVLGYSIVDFLSNPDKDRSKSDGTNLAMWLQNLASFVGATYKRMLNLDSALVLQYIANQLHLGNAKDLIILKELISQMGGVEVLQDLSASQVIALGGTRTLRAEALNPTTALTKKSTVQRSAPKLMAALERSELTAPLFLLIALQRRNAILSEPAGAHLKYLGVLADNCQQVLFQYIEFLRTELGGDDMSRYKTILPPIADLLGQHGLDPAVCFQLWRPALAAEIRPQVSLGDGGELLVQAVKAEAPSTGTVVKVESEPKVDKMDVEEEGIVEETEQIPVVDPASPWPAALNDAVAALDQVLPAEDRRILSSNLLATFWSLELYDVRFPQQRYATELDRLANILSDLDREAPNLVGSVAREQNKGLRAKVVQLRETLLLDTKIHLKQWELTRNRLLAEKSTWFPATVRTSAHRSQFIDLFLHYCVLPRAKLSPGDAAFTAQFVKNFHGYGLDGFATLKLFDRLFSTELQDVVFPCTEQEASNYGQFLRDLLVMIKSWYDSAKEFARSGHGKDKQGRYLPGLRLKPAKDPTEDTHLITHENLKTVMKKWTRQLANVCIEALSSGEYMHIRNGIAILKELDGLVPLFAEQGVLLEKAVAALIAKETREDVKVLAVGYQVMLKRASKTWIRPASAAQAPKAVSSSATPAPETKPRPSAASAPSSDKPSAPPARPATPAAKPTGNGRAAVSPAPTRPAGLPERPSSSRAPSTAPARPIINGSESRDPDPRAPSSLPPRNVSSEASQREAQARAAVQASQASRAAAARTQPVGVEAKAPDRRDADAQSLPSGPRADRLGRTPTPLPADTRPPAGPKGSTLPTGPKAEQGRRDVPARPLASMPPPASNHADRAPEAEMKRPRDDLGSSRDDRDGKRPRDSGPTSVAPNSDLRRESRGREDVEPRRLRDEPELSRARDDVRAGARSRNPSKDSIRSTRSKHDREKDRRSDKGERSERRRSSRERRDRDKERRPREDREHRDRDRDRDRGERDKERRERKERERERESRPDKDKHRSRDKDREAGRHETTDRAKDKDDEKTRPRTSGNLTGWEATDPRTLDRTRRDEPAPAPKDAVPVGRPPLPSGPRAMRERDVAPPGSTPGPHGPPAGPKGTNGAATTASPGTPTAKAISIRGMGRGGSAQGALAQANDRNARDGRERDATRERQGRDATPRDVSRDAQRDVPEWGETRKRERDEGGDGGRSLLSRLGAGGEDSSLSDSHDRKRRRDEPLGLGRSRDRSPPPPLPPRRDDGPRGLRDDRARNGHEQDRQPSSHRRR